MDFSPIITAADFIALPPESYILFDVSAGSINRYNNEHLSHAHFIDLEQDLAEIKDFAQGGRHPLPTLSKFTNTLGQFGVKPNSRVILYDDKMNANAAARFWWMLQAVGHRKTQVIDGGYSIALAAGAATSRRIQNKNATAPYPAFRWALPISTLTEVEQASANKNKLIIDVRAKDRYDGLTEPIDLIAGHIPNAINIPFTENVDINGCFHSPAVLHEKYKSYFDTYHSENIIVHCGSGVTACHSLLAMAYANFKIPHLYIGSWSEWSRNHKAIATK